MGEKQMRSGGFTLPNRWFPALLAVVLAAGLALFMGARGAAADAEPKSTARACSQTCEASGSTADAVYWVNWAGEIAFDDFHACCPGGSEPIRIRWETAWEVNILGFYLWRSSSENGVFTRLSDELIYARGTARYGAGYSCEDVWASCDWHPWYYQLEVIAVDGESRFLGPVSTCRYSGWDDDDDDDYLHATCFILSAGGFSGR